MGPSVAHRNWFITVFTTIAACTAAACSPTERGSPPSPAVGHRQGAATLAATRAAAPAPDPIGTVGHGGFFDAGGRPIRMTAELRARAQDFYLTRLRLEATPAVLQGFARAEATLRAAQPRLGIDDVTARSFSIGWLLEQVRPADYAHLSAKNTAIRNSHLADLRARTGGKPPTSGRELSDAVIKWARQGGYMALILTQNSGQKYIEECRKNGVPIPPTWGTSGWVHQGTLSSELFIPGLAEVYTYQPDSPAGLCIALPRMSGDDIGLLGIICMGKVSGAVCFWDHGSADADDDIPLTDFDGGADLAGGDVCSDCHAGENPFAVHPGTALDLGAALVPDVFQNPIIPSGWPAPGANTLLPLVPLGGGDQSCLSCHSGADHRRFPQVTPDLSGYCNVVLKNAINRTMPIGSPGNPAYQKHMDALMYFCDNKPPGGENVPGDGHDDDKGHVGPPIVDEPLYGCATKLEVSSVIIGATVDVSIDGSVVATVIATKVDNMPVDVPALVPGQKVYAVQTYNGVTSDKSNVVTVKDHKVEFPAGLPKAVIDPTLIYRCGHVIAVRHVQGAKVTVYVNGGSPVTTGGTSSEWTNVMPGISPFNLGDKYTAEYQVCDDKSPLSDEQVAVADIPPPGPVLDPATIYAGQTSLDISNLLNGALTKINLDGFGQILQFSTAVSWQPDIDIASAMGGPLDAGDSLIVTSELCTGSPRTVTGKAEPCSNIPPPKIQTPLVGQTFVTVTQSIPGSRILVFDQNDAELADAAGTVLTLTRALVGGDVLTVRQQVGTCFSAQAYQIEAMCWAEDQGC